ncbi:autotransporter assembly complex protein TamA [Legionella gresilensis]|uniref:autotransporter assembly complex protein TamA n=1 Tax=Legionella gresilensis TaxID=91823 RepID=UPI00104131B9|nr:POTRA domain-containing protein [Legionella gresilensis]
MNKTVRLLIIILCLPLFIAAEDVKNIQINGVSGKLLDNIQTRLTEIAQNKSLKEESEEELKSQVEKAMAPYGFFKPTIRISYQPNKTIFNIIPGPRLIVTKIDTNIIGAGKDNPRFIQALKELPIKSGKPFNSANYETAKQNLMSVAEQEGYLRASFEKSEVLIDRKKYIATIILIFDTGPQYYFGQVRFDPTYISPDLLHRFVPFKYGQPYSADKVLEFNNYLSGSGYFKAVNVQPKQNEKSQIIPIDVHLQRASRINYSLGLGFGTDTGIRGKAGVHIAPVNRAGHKFNAVALGSFNENSLQTQYVIPGKNPITDQYEALGSFSNLNYNAAYSNSLLLSLAQRHNLPTFQRLLSLNALFERFNYDNQPTFEKTTKNTLYPKATFTWLNKSDQLFSPNGYKLTLTGLGATKALLSDINFSQVLLDARAAYMVDPIRTRFFFHTIQGITVINDIYQLPVSLGFLLGGSDNLKGYNYNALGPGKILTYGGIEVQKETVENWYVIGFYDVGDVYKPHSKNVKQDVGLGLMWVSPVGPIKIGIAQAIESDFKMTSGKKPKLVINIGPDL